MQTNPININIRTQSPTKRAARRGAAITAGIMTISEGISWIKNPNEMKESVRACGGKINYIKNIASIICLYSVLFAVANSVFVSIANKINSKKSPKAAN